MNFLRPFICHYQISRIRGQRRFDFVTSTVDFQRCKFSRVTFRGSYMYITIKFEVGMTIYQLYYARLYKLDFYSASALLAMQSAVLARGIMSVCPSVCLSVCLSVTFRYCVQTNENTMGRF